MANNKLVNGDVLQALITELEKRSIGSLESTGSAITIKDLAGNTKDTLDVSIPSFTGATDSENGTSGLVPIPTAGKQDMALCGDATFKVLPIAGGGTGVSAASADALLKALIGSGSIGSSSQPIYYKDGKLYAGGYTFRLNHNTTDDKIPVFANGMLDYILKSELANATTGGGIVAALLEQNGYVKFANGLILQWGKCNAGTQFSFPIPYKIKCYAITFGVHYDSSQYGYNQVVSYDTLGFTMYQTVGTNGLAIMWIALGVQQWGYISIGRDATVTITMPIASTPINIQVTGTGSSSNIPSAYRTKNIAQGYFDIQVQAWEADYFWLALCKN